jgi:hypothetical protein
MPHRLVIRPGKQADVVHHGHARRPELDGARQQVRLQERV